MPTLLKNTICQRIQDMRKKRQYTQTQVADWLHMSQNAYSELESGKRRLDIERLYEIAALFNVTVHYLLSEPQEN
ncbi:MAG TPA: helix-turn-helix transcriptional regulator [Chitinophagaceae bacterium]|nr:helix-turn-helix transcriptional regulator [Chitinophagaceae bacterium]